MLHFHKATPTRTRIVLYRILRHYLVDSTGLLCEYICTGTVKYAMRAGLYEFLIII